MYNVILLTQKLAVLMGVSKHSRTRRRPHGTICAKDEGEDHLEEIEAILAAKEVIIASARRLLGLGFSEGFE